jgi:hypothetical protein
MMDVFRQGSGRKAETQRLVDIGKGRLVEPEKNRSRVKKRSSPMPRAMVLVLTSVLLIAALVTLSGCASQPSAADTQAIQIESVRLTAAGHYIDLRYRVLDSEQANELLGPGVKPMLIDEASGIVMEVPMTAKLGSLRQTRGDQRPDRTCFVLFTNTVGAGPGSVVTAEMGEMRFESLIIE